MTQTNNDHLVLISGASATGKSASLMNLKDQPGVIYLNTEANKKLPFKNKFQKYSVTNPKQIFEAFQALEDGKIQGHTIIIDSLTFLMDMYESQFVLTAKNKMEAWSHFQQYFKKLMQYYVARCKANVIFIAHTQTILNEDEQVMETKVPIKGALKANGIESYFSTVISTKKVRLTDLEKYESDLLHITDEDKAVGYKYCFQTKITENTTTERIRSPMGMFELQETFMDNDLQLVIDRLHDYYDE